MQKILSLCLLLLGLNMSNIFAQTLNSEIIYEAAQSADSTKIRKAVIKALEKDYENAQAIDHFTHYAFSYFIFEDNPIKEAALYKEFKPHLDKILERSPGILDYHLSKFELSYMSLSDDAPNILKYIIEQTAEMTDDVNWLINSEFDMYNSKDEVFFNMHNYIVSFFQKADKYDKKQVDNLYNLMEKNMQDYYYGNATLIDVNSALKNHDKVRLFTDKAIALQANNAYAYILAIFHFHKNNQLDTAKLYYNLGLKNIKDEEELQLLKSNLADLKL